MKSFYRPRNGIVKYFGTLIFVISKNVKPLLKSFFLSNRKLKYLIRFKFVCFV